MHFIFDLNLNNFNDVKNTSGNSTRASASNCFYLPDAKFETFHYRKETNLQTGVLNAVLSPFAVAANFLIVFVVSRRTSLQTPSNVLLGSLAVSDILVGLLVQPCYVVYRLLENANGFVPCAIRMLYSKGFCVYYGVSLTTLCGISWERFIALMYPLRYLEFVRRERVLKATLFIWLINVLLTSLHWVPEHNVVFRGVHLAMWSASLFIAVTVQFRIFPIIIRHQQQIRKYHSSSSQRQMQIKLAINIASIVATYIAFNLPVLLVTTIHQIASVHIHSYNLYSWSETMAFVNSSLNPLVCVWRVKAIRKAVRGIFPNPRIPGRRSGVMLNTIPNNNGVFLLSSKKITEL